MGRDRSALIIGGGIVGVTSAYALAREGWRVRILDADSDIALGASWGNGRQLSYSHTNALASPQMLRQIPHLLLGANEAFRMGIRPDRHFFAWLACFLSQSGPAAFKRNTLAALALASRSQVAMEHLLNQNAIEFEREKSGKLVLLRDQSDVEGVRAITRAKCAAGLEQHVLSRAEAEGIEPALKLMPDDFSGALYAPHDETGNCHLFAKELFKLTQREFGAAFHGNKQVASITRKHDESEVRCEDGDTFNAQLVVIASGHSANDMLAPLGHRLPIEPMKGYSFTAPIGNAAPRVSVTDNARRIVFTHLGDRMLVAGIAEMGRVNAKVDPGRVSSIKKAAKEALPEAAIYDDADTGWAGLRPVTPNSLPITRMLEPGLAVNAGHGMLGWTFAMGSSGVLAEAVARAH